jgi:TetR/AcrR family transcriptional repressor of lmrAB and yxaGH operons
MAHTDEGAPMKNSELSTRERMVQATCELLEAQGYHATGLNEILQRSDTPRGSLYYYFPDGKEELAVEAVERQGKFIEARLREDMAAYANIADAVRALFYKLASFAVASHCHALGPITAVALESSATNERLRQACSQVYASWRGVFEAKLLTCDFTPSEAASLATVILSAFEGASTLARTTKSAEPLQQMGDQLHFLLTAKQGTPTPTSMP